MTTTLTAQEKTLLKEIMSNQYAAGPFSGMIYNSVVTTNRPTLELVQQALRVRLLLKELTK